ncbi:DUF2243 domain-containing protein [Polyangium aurulentum]|uniref:DUF2243 domain-containing protein n=1 Tax=Polyangium aurulentum TaxID=2567896 RepID=UPI0010ADA74B|nr:DUF2243 domain-containing protein [Polyangium aurulentum]UQA60229.1 DUF2243 domain-containing protein [Polyangium aurulentum]
MADGHDQRPLIAAGNLLGVGMGGFLDGILFHQVLQLHGMLTARRPKDSLVNMQINMFWDGMFHVFTWVVTALGIYLLWRAAQRRDVVWSGRTLVGGMSLGWGMFNLVEGVIDHHVLHVHHVYERAGESIWDYAFLGSGVGLMLLGWALIRAAHGAAPLLPGGFGRTARPGR